MSTERDIERVLDAWLAPGPTEMPDRLYVDILDRIERTPQRRHAWTSTRFTSMFSPFKVPLAAGLAAIILAVMAIPVLIGGPDADVPGVVTDASPSPGTSPSPSARQPVPTAIQTTWVAAPKVIAGLKTESDFYSMWDIQRFNFGVGLHSTFLPSGATAVGEDLIRLETFAGVGCDDGDVGTYRWRLSERDRKLDLAVVEDACEMRSEFLDGDWTKAVCERDDFCGGILEAGRHGSIFLDPRGAPGDAPAARPGALSYELPDGWASAYDFLSLLWLMPAEPFERKLVDPDLWSDQISVWARPVAVTVTEPDCQFVEDPTGGETVESLAAWLTVHPELVVTEPEPIDIDGHPGLILDIEMREGAGTKCLQSFGGSPLVPLFSNGFALRAVAADPGTTLAGDGVEMLRVDPWKMGGWDLGSGGICPTCTSDPQRIILLDLDGNPVVILVDTEKPEDQAAFVERAMPIVESFTFPE